MLDIQLALSGLPTIYSGLSNKNNGLPQRSLKNIKGDGIFWAVPKYRRTIGKPLRVKTHLHICNQCGYDDEAGILCPHCHQKVPEEKKQMQDKIQEKLCLNPVEQEVLMLYEGECTERPTEFLNGKRIFEMPKPGPVWFTVNLLLNTTQYRLQRS